MPDLAVPALEVIGMIDVPDQVLSHRFVKELSAVVEVVTDGDEDGSPVAGTDNTKSCELYGWGPNVAPHCDRTGFVYLVCLNDGVSQLHAVHHGNGFSVDLRRGAVVRMWDGAEHWTEDDGNRVAAFAGAFATPDDAKAMDVLTAGIGALSRGEYYGSPRCARGFIALLNDECYVADFGDCTYSPMLIDDAKEKGLYIIDCACGAPAVRVDHHWPYSMDGCKCKSCLSGTGD